MENAEAAGKFSAENLEITAYRIWRKANENGDKKEKLEKGKMKNFLSALKDFIESRYVSGPQEVLKQLEYHDDDTSGFNRVQFSTYTDYSQQLTLLEQYDELRMKPPSDQDLCDFIRQFVKSVYGDDAALGSIKSDDRYLALFKAVWGEGVTPFLERFMERREALENADMLQFWRNSLRERMAAIISKESDETQRDAKVAWARKLAENEINRQIENTLDTIFLQLYEDRELPSVYDYGGALRTNSISEIQNIWKNEEGITYASWELKHKAYIKMVLIYSLIKVIGSIDFLRTSAIAGKLQKRISGLELISAVDQKGIPSTVLKFLRRFLSDSTEADPGFIKDNLRARLDVAAPEGVMDPENIAENSEEVGYYVRKQIMRVMDAIGTTSYSDKRLRTNYGRKHRFNKNSISGGLHRALQVTFLPLVERTVSEKDLQMIDDLLAGEFDVESCMPVDKSYEDRQVSFPFMCDNSISRDSKNLIYPLPEAVPFEVQFVAPLSIVGRKEDDGKFRKNKLREVGNLLGLDLDLPTYVSHVADLFIKKIQSTEEKEGGTPGLSEKERMAMNFLKILATEDDETIAKLHEGLKPKEGVYKSKLRRAIHELDRYWVKKAEVFFLKKIAITQRIIEHERKRLKIRIKETSEDAYTMEMDNKLKTVREDMRTLYGLRNPYADTPQKFLMIMETLMREIDEIEKINPHVAVRLGNPIREMRRYLKVHLVDVKLDDLIDQAQDGVDRIFSYNVKTCIC